MYKPDLAGGVLPRPTDVDQAIKRTENADKRMFSGDNQPHKDMLSQAADSFSNVSASALRLEDSVDEAQRVRIGIVGCGRIGQLHAANIANKIPDADLVCVSDYFESAALSVAKKHKVPMACTDYRDLINNAAVDAVLVCSPTDTHAEIIRASAAAGKHVFCEKPIDQSLAVIDELAECVEKSGVKFFLGFQRRFDTHFDRARKARESGFLGTPVKLHLTSRDPSPPPVAYLKQSGGIFLDQASHDFDMARYLVGSDVTEIMATGVAMDPEIGAIGDIDHAMCLCKFKNGCIVTIDNSRTSAMGYDQRAELFGTDGSISVTNLHPNETEYADRTGCHKDSPLNFFMERYADAYLREMLAFVDALISDKPVPCGINDGRLTVIYAAAARLSLAENRVVKVSEIDPSLG